MSTEPTYAIEVGEHPEEIVGRFDDGRQLLLTIRFGPVTRDDGEHTMLAQLIFDRDGAVLSSDVRSIGLSENLSPDAVRGAIDSALMRLPPLRIRTIHVHAIPVGLLGDAFAPITLTCDEDPGLHVTIGGNDGVFIPTLPFGRSD
jgi:hypothetical protein